MSSFPFTNNIDITENYNDKTDQPTYKIINECIQTRYHDIGCQCVKCKLCSDLIIDHYKKKHQKKININKSSNIERNINNKKSLPIPIPKQKFKPNRIDMYNSLPDMYCSDIKKIKNKKCLLCDCKNDLTLFNNFYFKCKKCIKYYS